MRIFLILISISVIINFNLSGQTRIIQGRIISEDLEGLPMVRIQNVDSVIMGETDMDGRFKIEVTQKTEVIILCYPGMEWTTIKLKNDCDTLEIIMMYEGTYDFMSFRKIDRLRLKRFKELPKLHQKAYEKGIFLLKSQCFEQDFVPIKPRLDEIRKDRIKQN